MDTNDPIELDRKILIDAIRSLAKVANALGNLVGEDVSFRISKQALRVIESESSQRDSRSSDGVGAKKAYTVKEAAKVFGLSRNGLYLMIARGDIPSVRLGKKIVISAEVIEKILSGEK